MDIVRSESDLVRSPCPADVVGRLEYRVVTPTRSCRLIPGSERARDGDYQHLRQFRRIVKILHSEVTQGINIMYALLAECSKRCCVEGIHNSRIPHIRVTQNK